MASDEWGVRVDLFTKALAAYEKLELKSTAESVRKMLEAIE
jgi:hypothetical protein